LNCAPSGAGKKAFHRPVEAVGRVLERIEIVSQTEAARSKSKLREIEKKIERLFDQEDSDSCDGSELKDLQLKAERLRALATARNLWFGEDATGAMYARSIVAPGQGGACAISSGEGVTFFSRFAGGSKTDAGYGTLLTQGFNDPAYKVSRVDEGRLTHNGTLEPRLCLTLSIQNSRVPAALDMVSADLGAFQRMLYIVEEQRMQPRQDVSLFQKEGAKEPFDAAYFNMVESIALRCWERSMESVELPFSDEAMERLDRLRYENDCLVFELEREERTWSQYVSRWTEQIIKLVQSMHVASCADPVSGEVNWKRVAKPITLGTLERTITLHDVWKEESRRFVDLWIKSVKAGIEKGLSVEDVKRAVSKAWEKSSEVEGVPIGDILNNLPSGTTSLAVRRLIENHASEFTVTPVGKRNRVLYRLITSRDDLINFIEEGVSNAA
jgi:hypothetical protein